MQEDRQSSFIRILMTAMAGLFMAAFLLLLIFGARSFQQTARSREANMELRNLKAYLSTAARSHDNASGMQIRESSELGPILSIPDGETGYALHIYHYKGSLLEDYAPVDAWPSPERSQFIAETGRFALYPNGDVIFVETDAGRTILHFRSKGGGQ